MEVNNSNVETLNIDKLRYNSSSKEKDELLQKLERRRKRKILKEITNKKLPVDYYQNIVELENIVLKDPNKENLFELINLYKVIISNY